MRSVAARFSVSGDKVLTLNPKILDDGSVLFLHCALETMVESLHQKASSSLSGTSSSSMFVKLKPLPHGVFPYMEKDTSGKDAVCEALCHQEASLPLRTEAASQPQEVAAPQTSPSFIAEFAKLDMTGSQAAVCWFHSAKCGLTLPRTS